MTYENRLPPEGINVTRENHLASVFWLIVGFVALVVASVVVLYVAGGFIASHMPFRWEAALTDRLSAVAPDSTRSPQEKRMQTLANRLAATLQVPEGMRFYVKYADDDDVNAYATLGGVITLHRGLTERLDSENALAFVLAHEMAHVLHRDPAEMLGGQLLVASVVGLISAGGGADLLQDVLAPTKTLTLLTFSRSDESAADEEALRMVGKLYGHLGGVDKVFAELVAAEHKMGADWVPEMLRTHPEARNRLASLPLAAEKLGFSLTGATIPLGVGLRKRAE